MRYWIPTKPVAVAAVLLATAAEVAFPASRAAAATTQPSLTQYVTGGSPFDLAVAPDGLVWSTNLNGSIGSVDPVSGAISSHTVPTSSPDLQGITVDSSGMVWFTEYGAAKVGRFDPAHNTFTEYPTPAAEPDNITIGPDGNVWFTEVGGGSGSQIAKLNPATGTITQYPVAGGVSFDPGAIVAGPDGDLWYAGEFSVGKITTSGGVTSYPVSRHTESVTVGPDGNIWFVETDSAGNNIGRIVPSTGAMTVLPLPGRGATMSMATGPDGNLWVTYNPVCCSWVYRVTTSGVATRFAFNGASPAVSGPAGIVRAHDGTMWMAESGASAVGRIGLPLSVKPVGPALASGAGQLVTGPDGNVWFTVPGGDQIDRLTPAGVLTQYSVPTAGAEPTDIALGGDGNLWFTEANAANIGRITAGGVITEFPIPSGNPAEGITAAPDGNVWFAEAADYISRITPAGTISEFAGGSGGDSFSGIVAGPLDVIWYVDLFDCTLRTMTLSGGQAGYISLFSGCPDGPMAIGASTDVWFSEGSGTGLARFDPATSALDEFPYQGSGVQGISQMAAGPDGSIWVTDQNGTSVDVVSPTLQIAAYPSFTSAAGLGGIALGPDGNMWFAADGLNAVYRLGSAAPGTGYVLEAAPGFIPAARSVPQGSYVHWTFVAPVEQQVADSSGMSLFGSGGRNSVDSYEFRFGAAATYAYTDLFSGHAGAIAVPLVAPATGSVNTPFTVVWGSVGFGPFVSDVQVKTPGATTWTPWQTGVQTTGAAYSPTVAGSYQFRARVRNGAFTKWSPVAKVAVT